MGSRRTPPGQRWSMRSTRTPTRQRGRIGRPRRSPATYRRRKRGLDEICGIITCRSHGIFGNIEVCIVKMHTAIIMAILGILAFIAFVLIVVVAVLPLVPVKLGMVLFRDVAIVPVPL